MMSTILKVQDLRVAFGNYSVLTDHSFELHKREVFANIGPNGAGKTVLFRALLGLLPYSGEISWMKHVKIGYVPQKLSIGKDLPVSVLDFLRFKKGSEAEVFEALRAVGFLGQEHDEHHWREHLLNARLGELSGGQLQRVLIAYALIDHPDILLFDEPTAGVDIGGEETIYALLAKLHHQHGLTILLITHDFNIVHRYAEKVLCLNRTAVCYGAPKEALTPKVLEDLYGSQVDIYSNGHKH